MAGKLPWSSSSRISSTNAASTADLSGKATVLGFFVAPFAQPYSRAKLVQPLHVLRRARQARLDHRADAAVALLPEGVEDPQRAVGVGRVLHVDPHEELVAVGRLEDP